MGMSLNGRIVLVTGASAGIGKAIAKEVVAQGGRVVLNARRAERLFELAKELSAGRPEPVAACAIGDAADQKVIDSMFEASQKQFRSLPDAVIVNAGRGLAGSVLTSDTGQWEEMIRTNVVAAALLIRAAAHRMIDKTNDADGSVGKGWEKRTPRDIVVIGSVVGKHVSPFSSMYGGTKFNVHGMAEGARRELAPKGVRVTLVQPGFVVSEFQGVAGYEPTWFQGAVDRIGPVLEPEDVARTITFVLAQPAYVHVSDILVRPTRQDYP